MGKVIVVANQKAALPRRQLRSIWLLVWPIKKRKCCSLIWSPGNASSGLGINKNALEHSVYDVLVNFVPIDKVTMEVNPRLFVVPAKVELAGAEMELVAAISVKCV